MSQLTEKEADTMQKTKLCLFLKRFCLMWGTQQKSLFWGYAYLAHIWAISRLLYQWCLLFEQYFSYVHIYKR